MVGVAVVGGLGYYIYQQFGMHATFVKARMPRSSTRSGEVRGPVTEDRDRETATEADVTLAKPVAAPASLIASCRRDPSRTSSWR